MAIALPQFMIPRALENWSNRLGPQRRLRIQALQWYKYPFAMIGAKLKATTLEHEIRVLQSGMYVDRKAFKAMKEEVSEGFFLGNIKIDKDIRALIDYLNELPCVVSTACCSGHSNNRFVDNDRNGAVEYCFVTTGYLEILVDPLDYRSEDFVQSLRTICEKDRRVRIHEAEGIAIRLSLEYDEYPIVSMWVNNSMHMVLDSVGVVRSEEGLHSGISPADLAECARIINLSGWQPKKVVNDLSCPKGYRFNRPDEAHRIISEVYVFWDNLRLKLMEAEAARDDLF